MLALPPQQPRDPVPLVNRPGKTIAPQAYVEIGPSFLYSTGATYSTAEGVERTGLPTTDGERMCGHTGDDLDCRARWLECTWIKSLVVVEGRLTISPAQAHLPCCDWYAAPAPALLSGVVNRLYLNRASASRSNAT